MKNETISVSVVIPTYNMGKTIEQTIRSVLNQSYQNFEIIVQDNCSTDDTFKVVSSIHSSKIRFFKNKKNLGYAKNLIEGSKKALGEVLFFLGADDILSKFALQRTVLAFEKGADIGAVTRPYYWFQESIDSPIRVTPSLNTKHDEIVDIDDIEKAMYVLHNEILGQLSGLAFRRNFLIPEFFTHDNDWIAHGYPFVNIFKDHPVVFLKDYQVAIRIGGNSIRQKGSSLYTVSPTKRWVEMLDELLNETRFLEIKKRYKKNIIGANYIGLVQIRCYSTLKNFLKEVLVLLELNWLNALKIEFWFFVLGCAAVPPSLLAKMVDTYKKKINNQIIRRLKFEYNID